MTQAEALYFTFWLLAAWRYLVWRLEETSEWLLLPAWIRLCLNYYSILYTIFGTLLCSSLVTAASFIDEYRWLDPETFGLPGDAPANELVLPYALRLLSLGTPVATFGTFLFTSYHIATHVRVVLRRRSGLISAQLQRDRVIQVLALPMVYGSMSFSSVNCMWGLFTGRVRQGQQSIAWKDLQRMEVNIYHSNFQTADLYEAWALYQFAELCLDQISSGLTKQKSACRTGSESPTKEQMGEENQLLVKTVHRLTAQGVLAFVLVCGFNASYRLALAFYTVMFHADAPVFFSQDLDRYFVAMGLVASTEAIMNVIIVESTFHAQLEDFRPKAKFWSTKVLVSIAFMQEAVIGLCALSQLQQYLLYSCLICYEVFALSLFHIFAWPASEGWLSLPRSRLSMQCQSALTQVEMARVMSG
mmetsp:Transcript_112622/g.223950  ORF Transcript_112622/g.223950 Transcript_112622/m.223950 type:complete len:416 (-) Transcript_112622:6-1253(-)